MRVQVENTGTLGRRMTVSLPAERLEEEISTRLTSLSRDLKLPGFRPGKVPPKLVEAKYGARVLQEVAGELIQISFRDALGQEGLQPAGGPAIEPKSFERGQDLEYVAVFEVYPELGEITIAGSKIERPQCEVQESDADRTIENMRKQRVSWDKVFRAAQDEDRVTVDFTGAIDGEAFAGGDATDFGVVLGSGSLLEEFENGLVGASAGDERHIPVQFPDNYVNTELAGKRASFEVQVKEVAQPRLPELDDAFAKAFGVESGGVEKLRAEVKQNLERETDDRIRTVLRTQVMGALLGQNKIEIPERLVGEEIDRMVTAAQQDLKGRGVPANALEADRTRFEEEARRRVALGIIVFEVVKTNNLKADPARVRARLEHMATGYDNPEAFIQWYYADRSRLEHLEAMVLEEQVVEHLLQEADLVDKPMTFGELMHPQPAEPGERASQTA